MSQKEFIKKYYQLNETLFNQAKNPLKCHGPDHHLRVCILALELAEKENINVNVDILIPACLLHDMSAFYPDEIGLDRYHDEDPKLAQKALEESGEGRNKIEEICKIIALHGHEFKSEKEPIEATLLRDADKVEAMGPIGIARMIMSQTKRGLNLNQIVDKFYTQGMIDEKWENLTTNEAKRLAREDYKYTLNFFKRLKETLEAHDPR